MRGGGKEGKGEGGQKQGGRKGRRGRGREEMREERKWMRGGRATSNVGGHERPGGRVFEVVEYLVATVG